MDSICRPSLLYINPRVSAYVVVALVFSDFGTRHSVSNDPRPHSNAVRLAFYTALQLERWVLEPPGVLICSSLTPTFSDILAEFDFQPSGIRKIENVNYPDGYFPEDEATTGDVPPKSLVMSYYSYQLHLRKLLDTIQQEVYAPSMSHFKIGLTDTDPQQRKG